MIFEKQYTLQPAHIDPCGRARPSALLGFALDAAGKHCVQLGADREALAEKHLFWAVLRHRLQILRYPTAGEHLTVKTWPMPTTRSAYPRAAVALDAAGQVVFRLVSLWVLMDISARNMVLPGKSGVGVDGLLLGDELPMPTSIPPVALTETATRRVEKEDLDFNNHMTNTRYLDWVDDLQTEAFRRAHPPKEIQICYLSEALPGQEIRLGTCVQPDGFLQTEGFSARTNVSGETTRVFAAKIYF